MDTQKRKKKINSMMVPAIFVLRENYIKKYHQKALFFFLYILCPLIKKIKKTT
jgi:hypothetical protein